MSKLLSTILFMFLACSMSVAQNVQWAAKVVSYSSQYGDKDYSAQQVLGFPNQMNDRNRGNLAWVPKKEQSSKGEFIHVEYERPMYVKQVAVAESLNPGAIYRIYLLDTDGKKHRVYENKNLRQVRRPFRLFTTTFEQTNYRVKGVRLELKTKALEGSNQIDAIGISDSQSPIELKVKTLQNSTTYEDKNPYKIENLGGRINSGDSERLPIISPDGKTLFFARKWSDGNMGKDKNDDIYVSHLDPLGYWSEAENIGKPLNNNSHNFVISTNVDGSQVYLAGDYYRSAESGMSTSKKRGRAWSKPSTYDIRDNYNESKFVGYYVNPEGSVMLYSVERKEGLGYRDIYVCFRESGKKWSKPRSLGKTINTAGDESSVFLALDGKTLYFSSEGHPGFGGYDMFISKRLDNTWRNWSEPINMGNQINSEFNEYNYSIPAKGDWAYFASEKSQYGGSDLYRIELPKEFKPEPVVLVNGRLVDPSTGNPFKSNLKIKHKDKSKTSNIETDDEGRFSMVVPYGDDVSIYGQIDGYYVVNENVNLSNENEEIDGEVGGSTPRDNAEIDKLEALLNKLKNKLTGSQVERDTPREEETVEVPKSKQIDNVEKSSGLQQIKDKYKKRRKRNEVTKESEDELDRLKKTYNKPEEDKLTKMKNKYKDFLNGKSDKKDEEEADESKDDELVMEEEIDLFDESEIDIDEEPIRQPKKKTKTKKKETPKVKSKPKKEEPIVEEEPEEEIDEAFEKYKEAYKKYLTSELANEIKQEIYDNNIQRVYKERLKGIEGQYNVQLDDDKRLPIIKESLNDLEETNDKRKERGQLKFDNSIPQRDAQIEEELDDFWRPILKKELKKSLQKPALKEINKELDYRIRNQVNLALKRKLKEKIKESESMASAPIKKEKPLKKEYKEIEKDIYVIPIIEGQVIQLNNVFFDANKATLKASSKTELERVYQFMVTNSNIAVEIRGHTNGLCSHEFANQLSDDRAQMIVNYLVNKGISAKRMKYHGYGKTDQIADNDSRAGRRKNQRVELKIITVD